MKDAESRSADPEETGRVVKAIIDPLVAELGSSPGVAALGLGDAMQYYDDRLQRVPQKQDWASLVPHWRCATCDNRTPLEFESCYVCGTPSPAGTPRPRPQAAMAGPPGPPGPPG